MTADTATPATPAGNWAPAPSQALLGDGDLHVWRADLTAVPDEVAELLSPEEHARAQRLLGEGNRRRWTRAHGLLRTLLGHYLNRDPRMLRMATERYGKPVLMDDAPGSSSTIGEAPATPVRLAFNISHSGQLALFALAEIGSVGIDVEVARRPIRELAIAARTFGRNETKRLEAMDPRTREREFLRLWVRHEAQLKCRGTGIGASPPLPSRRALWIAELDVGPRAAAAVAATDAPQRLCCWDWRG